MLTRRLLLAFLFTILGWSALCGDAASAGWKGGVGKAKITPPHLMFMSGYGGRDHAAEGKLTDLWTKAMVLEDESGHRVALISLDLLGINRELSRSVCQELEDRLGLSRASVALSCSHTHTGPVVGRNLDPLHYRRLNDLQKRQVDDYTVYLQKRIVEAAAAAIENLEPCTLQQGLGRAVFAVNRRENSESKVPELRAEGKLKGPQDHDVPVLAMRSVDGQLRGVAFGYACHATVLSFYQWSGDYPGFAQATLEERFPGAVALFWAGCGADQNPLPRRTPELARNYGVRLAAAVERVITQPMTPVAASLETNYQEIPLALDTLPSREQIEKDSQSSNKFIVSRANMLLEQLDKNGKLAQTYPYPIQVWKLGDKLNWVFMGGEVVVEYALQFKNASPGKATWVCGYANDVMAYIPSLRVLKEGGYEGDTSMIYYGLPTKWSPKIETHISETVLPQIR